MKVLLITSSDFEFSVICKTFPALKCLDDGSYSAAVGGLDLNLINTGTGMVAASYHLTRYLQKKDFDLVIDAGICGSFRKEFEPGSILLVNEEIFADLGADSEEGFLDLFELGLRKRNDFPFRDGKLLHDPGIFEGLFEGIPTATGVTVNKVTGTDKHAAEMLNRYDADVETMEGAAFFYVCLNEKLNFAQLRSVSNYVGKRQRRDWKLDEAMQNLSLKLKEIFESYE